MRSLQKDAFFDHSSERMIGQYDAIETSQLKELLVEGSIGYEVEIQKEAVVLATLSSCHFDNSDF